MITACTAQACDLVLFGAKGDLVKRKLIPSLYRLEQSGAIHPETRIIGVGRANWDVKTYTNILYIALKKFMHEPINETLWCTLSARFDFCNLDVNEIDHFSTLAAKLNQEVRITVNYLAMPPNTLEAICKGLGAFGLNKPPNRLAIEKPLGLDLISSQLMNNQIEKYFSENQIYRIDHYLGKETVLNLLTLRFANSLFAYNWDNRTIDHVQITVAEEIGIERRWSYFDQVGQMRDMIQSHLLQILAIIAMSPPSDLTTNHIRDEKIKVLRSLRPINRDNINYNVVRGQYINGFIRGKQVPGYLEEDGANITSLTETFVSIRVNIDTWNWIGVPFYLRTGKRLLNKYSEIVIYFKSPALNLFRNYYSSLLPQNKLTIRLQPDEGIDIQILNKVPGLNYKHDVQTAKLNLSFTEMFCKSYYNDAYERLLLEMMRGMQTLFVCRDEIEASWKWIDSIRTVWKEDNNAPQLYQAGTIGPIDSINMINRDGRAWNKI